VQTKTLNLLICESNANQAAHLQQLFAAVGCQVDIAPTISQAKTRLRENGHQALILDLSYPDQGGIALIRTVRDDEKTQALPIIVISPQVSADQASLSGAAVEIVDWLDKPVD